MVSGETGLCNRCCWRTMSGGELDPLRRERFWSAVPKEAQVIATGTTTPDSTLGNWQVFRVENGGFSAPDGIQ